VDRVVYLLAGLLYTPGMVFSTKTCSPKPRTTLKECLDQHDLGEVVLTNFRDAGIDDVELATRLDDEQLQTLGVEKMGTRLKLRDTLSAALAAKNVSCFNVFEPLGSMSHDTVISLLTNMGVVSALLASLLFGIVMTIPHEEAMLGDKRFLSISSLAFRCQFADWSDPKMTLEICSPELTVLNVQKAMSPMDVSCNDGNDWLDQRCQMELCDRSEFLESNNEFDAGDKERMQARFLSAGDVIRVLNGKKVTRSGRPSSHGCTARAFQLAEHIASAVSDEDYLDLIYSLQADEHGRITGKDPQRWSLGITSSRIAQFGFSACSKLMAVVFLSLFGIISLSITDAAVNVAEMNLLVALGGLRRRAGCNVSDTCWLPRLHDRGGICHCSPLPIVDAARTLEGRHHGRLRHHMADRCARPSCDPLRRHPCAERCSGTACQQGAQVGACQTGARAGNRGDGQTVRPAGGSWAPWLGHRKPVRCLTPLANSPSTPSMFIGTLCGETRHGLLGETTL